MPFVFDFTVRLFFFAGPFFQPLQPALKIGLAANRTPGSIDATFTCIGAIADGQLGTFARKRSLVVMITLTRPGCRRSSWLYREIDCRVKRRSLYFYLKNTVHKQCHLLSRYNNNAVTLFQSGAHFGVGIFIFRFAMGQSPPKKPEIKKNTKIKKNVTRRQPGVLKKP